MTGLQVLTRVQATRPRAAPRERCEMCGETLAEEHAHVVSVANRALLCSCRPCYLLFTHDDTSLAYRAVPERYLSFASLSLSPGQWDDLQVPVSTVFLFHNSVQDRTVAFYPSPAGATESELPLVTWSAVLDANPALATLKPDVEALLLTVQDQGVVCFLVPIDACYELVGTLRSQWRGFDGGREVEQSLEAFFARIAARARPA